MLLCEAALRYVARAAVIVLQQPFPTATLLVVGRPETFWTREWVGSACGRDLDGPCGLSSGFLANNRSTGGMTQTGPAMDRRGQ